MNTPHVIYSNTPHVIYSNTPHVIYSNTPHVIYSNTPIYFDIKKGKRGLYYDIKKVIRDPKKIYTLIIPSYP